MISENSLRQISHIFCGDTDGLYSYKSGPRLVSFFNQHFQANDQYVQGFPLRWAYVYDKLAVLLNNKKFDSFLDLILSKSFLMQDLGINQVEAAEKAEEILKELN